MASPGWRRAAIALSALAVVAAGAALLARRTPRHTGAALVDATEKLLPVRPYTGAPAQLTGEVHDERGRPVPGATVLVNSAPPTVVRTDLQGRFSVAGLAAQKYTVIARSEQGVSPRAVADLSRPDAAPVTLTLKLARAASLAVSVVDATTGAPIPDAGVVARGLFSLSARTDVAGRVEIDGLEVSRAVVKAAAPGHATAWSVINPTGPQRASLTLALGPGVTVSGRVLSAPDRGVSGAVVTAERAGAFYEVGGAEDGARTNDDGRFVLDGVAPGHVRFRATHPDFPDAMSGTVDAAAPAIGGVEIQLEPGQAIAGRVLAAGGQAVAGGSVVAWYQIGDYLTNESRTARVDANGAFVLAGLHRGLLSVQASTPLGLSGAVTVEVGPPRAASLELTVDTASGLAGRLVLPDDGHVSGVPVTVKVLAARDNGPLGGRMRRTDSSRTDGAGRFLASGLAPGVYTVSARLPLNGVTWRAKETLPSGGGGSERSIRLVPGAELVGRALTAGGAPLFGLRAAVDGEPATISARPPDFAIKGMTPGAHEILLSMTGFAPVLIERVNLAASQTLDVGEVRFMPARTICGRVTGADGSPVQGARIVGGAVLVGDGSEMLVPEASRIGTTARALSDPQGRFCLRRVGNEPLTIAVQAADGRMGAVGVPAGAQAAPLAIAVDRPGALHGVVSSRSGRVAGIDVVAVPVSAEGQRRMVRLGSSGEFEFQRLPAGAYTVGVMLERAVVTSQIQTRQAVVPAGGVAEVQLDLELGETALRVATSCTGVDDWPSQVYVVAGDVGATTLGDIDIEVWSGRHSVFGLGLSYPMAPAWVPSLPPGRYSVCASRPAPPSQAPGAAAGAGGRPIACLPVTVPPRRSIQDVTVPCS